MNHRKRTAGALIFLAFIWMCSAWTGAQEKPLDNAEIIKLKALNMGDAVIIGKIKSAKEVKFETSTDDLVKLKEAGISDAVIAAMLERLSAPAAAGKPPAVGSDPGVQLKTKDGTLNLKAIFGTKKTQAAMFSVVNWVQFNDPAAKTRIRDPRPVILLESDKDPRGAWFIVQVSVNNKKDDVYRYFDLEGGGGVFSNVWSGEPEKGSIVKFDVTQEGPNLWRLTPLKDLKPGEYGLFSGRKEGEGILYDFGIDR